MDDDQVRFTRPAAESFGGCQKKLNKVTSIQVTIVTSSFVLDILS